MSVRVYLWIFAGAFDLWFWIEFVKAVQFIWKYCYCGG